MPELSVQASAGELLVARFRDYRLAEAADSNQTDEACGAEAAFYETFAEVQNPDGLEGLSPEQRQRFMAASYDLGQAKAAEMGLDQARTDAAAASMYGLLMDLTQRLVKVTPLVENSYPIRVMDSDNETIKMVDDEIEGVLAYPLSAYTDELRLRALKNKWGPFQRTASYIVSVVGREPDFQPLVSLEVSNKKVNPKLFVL